jgi:hypothetical protein
MWVEPVLPSGGQGLTMAVVSGYILSPRELRKGNGWLRFTFFRSTSVPSRLALYAVYDRTERPISAG